MANVRADAGELAEALRSVNEAMTMIETSKERVWEAEVNRIAGEIALNRPTVIQRRQKPISSVRSLSRVNNKPNLGNSAPQ